MNKQELQWHEFLIALVLSIIGGYIQWFTFKDTPFIFNSDISIFALTADLMSQGHWTFFQLQDNYGGVVFTVFRKLFADFLFIFSHSESLIYRHLIFNLWVTPACLIFFGYLALRHYCTLYSSVIIGGTFAFGFNFFYSIYGVDFYFSTLLYGFLIIILASHGPNPWTYFKTPIFLLFGILAGINHYNHRMADIYTLAYFVPWAFVIPKIRSLSQLKNGDITDKILWYLGLFFLLFYFYLSFIGGHLGEIFHRPIKLHADANLELMLIFWGLGWLKNNGILIFRPYFSKICLFTIGIFIGYSPELISSAIFNHELRATLTSATVPSMLTGMGQIPIAIKNIVSGNNQFNSHITFILVLISLWQLIKLRNKKYKYFSVLSILFLGIFVFVFKRPYEEAPTRYLISIFPVLLIACGVSFELIKNKFIKVLVIISLLIHLLNQWEGRQEILLKVKLREDQSYHVEILDKLRKNQIKIVITESFEDGNHRTLLAQWNPIFLSYGAPVSLPIKGWELLQSEKKVGVLIRTSETKIKNNVFHFYGKDYSLNTPIAQFGDYQLFISETQ